MSDDLTPQKEASWQIMDRATAQRKLLLAAGYVPIAIDGKVPIIPEWQKQQPTAGDVDKWPQLYPCAFNTGILTRITPTVDIDVHDATVVEELKTLLWDVVGEGHAMVRIGQAPKCAILFQTDQPFAKLSTPIFTSPEGRKHHVEVLGDGQQVVVFGKHPETGGNYTWHFGEPGKVERDALPYINAELAAQYIARCKDCMREHGWLAEDKKNGKASQPPAAVREDFDELYGEREQKYALAALSGCAIELAGTAEGARNEKLNKMAYHMGTMIVRGWIEEAAVIDALIEGCDRNNYLREHGRNATVKTIKSGINAGCKEPHLDLPGEATGTIVVPIHHYGKNAGVGLRGASAWRANADFVLSVMADIDPQTGDVSNRQLAIAKDRDGSQGPLTPFMLKWVELVVDDCGNPWGSMVGVAETSTAKPVSHWPPSLSVFHQALLVALGDSGFEHRPFADGPILQVVEIKWVKSEFAKVCHVDSQTDTGRQEALRKQFARKLTDAQQRKLVGVQVAPDRTLIWLVRADDKAGPDGHSTF